MGSHLAGPHRARTGHQLTACKLGGAAGNPHPLLCGWKGASAREDVLALQAAGPRGDGGGGELPPPRQEGPPQLPFWGPIPPFPISSLNWGEGHYFPQAWDLRPLEPVGDGGRGRPWVADA